MRLLPVLGWFLAPGLAAPLGAALSSTEQAIVREADLRRDEFGRDLAEVVAIDSATENLAGVRQMSDWFARQFSALGFETRFAGLPAETKRAGHFIAERHGRRGKRLLLIGHLDTVFPGANFRRDGDHVTGAGVADMKGGDLVLLHALKALHAAGALEDTQLVVVFSGDEEAPGAPLDVARHELREAAKRSDLALAFESIVGRTGTVARRGNATWELVVQGATGHSSGMFTAAMGDGAVFEAARILTRFHDDLRAMDGITVNPALVAGGVQADVSRTEGTLSGKSNIIAQRMVVRGDLRFLSAAQLDEAKSKMQAALEHPLPRTSATLRFLEGTYPAMPPTPENYALLAQLSQASLDLGLGEITAFDPRGRGAGDIAFVSPPLPGLDGLGLGGTGEHTVHEAADLSTAPDLIKRTAILIYRLTR